jgi:hypothetical protein
MAAGVVPVETTEIGRVTGAGSFSRTDERFGIYGTDLGIMWDGGDERVFVLFGDTYGRGWGGDGAGPDDADWRCNVLAFSADRELGDGMRLDSVVTRKDGLAAQVIASGGGWRREVTVIPNSGIAVDGRQYVHYMSVHEWGLPGGWTTNHAGIAVSEDGGETWSKPTRARWKNGHAHDHPFQIGAFTRDGDHRPLRRRVSREGFRSGHSRARRVRVLDRCGLGTRRVRGRAGRPWPGRGAFGRL